MKIFFTSDQHFNHRNIIHLCSRPFESVEAMNEELIRRHNSVVSSSDLCYIIGDFGFGSIESLSAIVSRLNGDLVLIRGNHDGTRAHCEKLGLKTIANNYMEFSGGILLTHTPAYRVEMDINFCGHVHNKWKVRSNMVNVGVDVWDFTPRTMTEMLADPEVIRELREWKLKGGSE